MRCFKVTVEYDGTDFAGFQYQHAQRTVQGEIEAAIQRLTGHAVRVNGAGRTDAGVHALGQVVSFGCDTGIPIDQMPSALNSALPRDISAGVADEVDERFHARFSARSRVYGYVILNRLYPSALFRRYALHRREDLDLAAMREAAALVVGTHDFSAWANSTQEASTTVRCVSRCSIRQAGRLVLVYVEANAFLRGMVRNIVGTLLEVGSGKRAATDMRAITASRSRAEAGPSAPAHGLTLVRVRY